MSRPTRPARAGATLVGLLLSAGVVPLTAAPALAVEETVEQMKAHTSAHCDSLGQFSDEGPSSASIHMPRSGQPIAAAADADAQTARLYGIADLRGSSDDGNEACSADASFENTLHVGAGTSGLADGDEVTLVATVAFDPLLDELSSNDQEHITHWRVSGGYTVVDPEAECIPDEESGDWCEEPDPLARFTTYSQRTSWGELGVPDSPNPYVDPDGSWDYTHDWDWSLTSNSGQSAGDDGSNHEDLCPVFPCYVHAPSEVDFGLPAHELEPRGPQSLVFRTQVGATLEVSGAVSLLVQAYDGDVAAFVDATDGLSADLAPADGFEGLQLTLGDDAPPPPLDTTAPVVTATPSSAQNAAGWHKDPVTVQLAATDAGSGVESVSYAVDGGAPTTVSGASAPVAIATNGTTTLTYTAKDVAGNVSEPQTLTVKLDRTAPTLHLPSGVTVAATGPAGAVVNHTHTVTDDLSGATSSCTPAAGSTFAVGTTTVTCTAVDGAGNGATASFPVTVTAQAAPQTPAQRIDDLQARVAALQAPPSVKATLGAKLAQAESFVGKGKKPQACTHLAQFVDHVQKNTGKGLTPAIAAALTNDARAARTALGC